MNTVRGIVYDGLHTVTTGAPKGSTYTSNNWWFASQCSGRVERGVPNDLVGWDGRRATVTSGGCTTDIALMSAGGKIHAISLATGNSVGTASPAGEGLAVSSERGLVVSGNGEMFLLRPLIGCAYTPSPKPTVAISAPFAGHIVFENQAAAGVDVVVVAGPGPSPTALDVVAGVEARIDGGSWQSLTEDTQTPGTWFGTLAVAATLGNHAIDVRASTGWNQISESSTHVTVVPDSLGPSIVLVAGDLPADVSLDSGASTPLQVGVTVFDLPGSSGGMSGGSVELHATFIGNGDTAAALVGIRRPGSRSVAGQRALSRSRVGDRRRVGVLHRRHG